jgi:probable HAF family extracellular repeat protein
MIPQTIKPDSHSTSVAITPFGDNASYVGRYATHDGYRAWIPFVFILGAIGGAVLALAQDSVGQEQTSSQPRHYVISDLPSLGGTNSRGNSINNRDWIAGYSTFPTNQTRHAALWRHDAVTDLGTLGGPNSTVAWNVKNNRGILVGIAQTATPEPLGEAWSSAPFYGGPYATGYITLGFVWERGRMRGLPTLGGDNGYATGANNRRIAVGWAETACHDSTCVPPQVLQFRPVWWDLDRHDRIHEFPLPNSDTSGAATAINDEGQAVGISGICDQAVGRYTAKHALLWDKNRITDLGNLGALWWNTPTAINERGDIIGFAGQPAYPEGDYLTAFVWTKKDGIKPLPPLPGHLDSEAYGINARRQVVGISCDADFADCRAVMWENGVVTDLNTLKQSSYGPRLEQAKDIDNDGEITGRAIDPVTSVRTAFVAEPSHCHNGK